MAGPEYLHSKRGDNLHYIDARREAREYRERHDKQRKKYVDSFGSQEINVTDYIISPEGWEGVMFTFYFLAIPYITGIIFLFFFVARSDLDNFLVLDISAFFVVWAIGYEIVASLILLMLFVSYIKWVMNGEHKKVKRSKER